MRWQRSHIANGDLDKYGQVSKKNWGKIQMKWQKGPLEIQNGKC